MKQGWILTILISAVLLPLAAAALMTGGSKLSGDAFSAPGYKVVMPEEWRNRGIQHEPWAQGSDLAVSTDQHLYPAVLPIIKKFAHDNNLKIEVKNAVCGITKGRLARKTVDVTTDCCPPGLDDRLPGLKFYTLGIAPMAFFVNATNPVDNISYNEARLIFQGKLRNWSQVHGRKTSIHPVTRLHCKNKPGMWRLMLAGEELFGSNIHDVKTINDMILSVASDPNAIGFESLWQIKNHQKAGKVKTLKIDGLDPADPRALRDGVYPIYMTYTLTLWEGKGLEKKQAGRLIEYIKTKINNVKDPFYIVTADSLKKAGWQFRDHELIGEIRSRQ